MMITCCSIDRQLAAVKYKEVFLFTNKGSEEEDCTLANMDVNNAFKYDLKYVKKSAFAIV